MEEVTVVPMVDPMVSDNHNNAEDDVVVLSDNPVASVCVKESEEHIDGDVVTRTNAMNMNQESSAEPATNVVFDGETMEFISTPITRSASCRPARRKRGALGLFRAVFLSFNGSHSTKRTGDATTPKKKAGADDDNDVESKAWASPAATSWKSIVDSMRPLRLPGQDLEYYPPPPPLMEHADVYHDVLLAPPSPPTTRSAGSEGGMTSRYASAQDLHLLDCGEQEVDEEEDALATDEGSVGGSCPHAIDMQAEEFIAKFYEQFKSESFNGRATQ